jgi:hypothetical protein
MATTSKRKRAKKNPYSRLGPVGYSEQYRRWNAAAKKGDEVATAEAHLAHFRFLQTRPWAQKIDAAEAPALDRAA